jgi:catechol 2,3-dioxygenase-like lactoylglutathione lyase family enzyme
MNLNHLYLRIRDLDRSADFYRRYFEFDGLSEWQGETFVLRNGQGFALALTPDPSPPPWPDGLHFGFLIDSVEVVRDLHRRMANDGVAIVEAYFEPGFAVFKCLDPDGYVVEVEAGTPTAPPP